MPQYTWKCGVQYSSNVTLTTNRPLAVDKIVIDLLDGRRYRVDAIYTAKTGDKDWAEMPNTVVHTWPAGALNDEELNALRLRAQYETYENARPLDAVVFDL